MYMYIIIGIIIGIIIFISLIRYVQVSISNNMTFNPSSIPSNGFTYVNNKFNGNIILDSFTDKNGKKLWYMFYNKTKAPSWNDHITFLCHGNGGNIVTSSEYKFTDKLAETSSVFIFDYRGYGLSEGIPTERNVYEDAKSAWDFVTKKHPDIDTIIPLGHSLGTSILCHLMKEELVKKRKIPPVILLSAPFYNGKEIAHEVLPYLGYLNSNKFNTYSYLSIIKKLYPVCEIIYIHSEEDDVIGFHHSKKLQNNIGGTIIPTLGTHDQPRLNKNIEELFYLLTKPKNTLNI